MRKYLQLIFVLGIFFFFVAVRHLREPAGLSPVVARSASSPGSQIFLASSPTPQPTVTQPAVFVETPISLQPTVTIISATSVANPTPTATIYAIPTPPIPTITVSPTPSAAPSKWPSLFDGAVFKDGAFTGAPSRTSYGPLQVTVVMEKGHIDDVIIVSFPARTPTSERTSAQILPGLIAQAITEQDWDVDIVSGATQTTMAFQRAMVLALRAAERG